MKKTIAIGLLVICGLLSRTSKEQVQVKKEIQIRNNSSDLMLMNSNFYQSVKYDEPRQSYVDTSLNDSPTQQLPKKHFSTHRKGKIIYTAQDPERQTIVLE